jgi:hypothetical protein
MQPHPFEIFFRYQAGKAVDQYVFPSLARNSQAVRSSACAKQSHSEEIGGDGKENNAAFTPSPFGRCCHQVVTNGQK